MNGEETKLFYELKGQIDEFLKNTYSYRRTLDDKISLLFSKHEENHRLLSDKPCQVHSAKLEKIDNLERSIYGLVFIIIISCIKMVFF